jgi:hypothetical protein
MAAICFDASCQDPAISVEDIMARINKEVPPENGCKKSEMSYNDCTINYSLVCGEDIFNISMNLDEIGRVYKDKADLDDSHETLFFECKDDKNCITSDSDRIPPSPVFPIRLPDDETSTLGEDALRTFSELINRCE